MPRSFCRFIVIPHIALLELSVLICVTEVNLHDFGICFVEFNPDKEGVHRVCIGAYCAEEEDTKYYAPYITAERIEDE